MHYCKVRLGELKIVGDAGEAAGIEGDVLNLKGKLGGDRPTALRAAMQLASSVDLSSNEITGSEAAEAVAKAPCSHTSGALTSVRAIHRIKPPLPTHGLVWLMVGALLSLRHRS